MLFISRAHPPVIGGIENHNYALSKWLTKRANSKTLANHHGKKFLPFFMPYAIIYTLISLRHKDTLLLGDGVLGIIGWIVKILYRDKRKVICILHGLDLTYPQTVYQRLWVGHFIPACDQLIAVGNETIQAGVTRGIPRKMFTFIPNGVDTEKFSPENIPRDNLSELIHTGVTGKKILYSGGRLIKRKGADWFIKNVMPDLPENIIFVISGSGPNKVNIQKAIDDMGFANRVILLGLISDEERKVLLNTCDIFIQPNVPVPGDMEGFGLVVLEAASTGIPVIASNIEGLKDAIHNNKNGILAQALDAESFKQKILLLLKDDLRRKKFGRKARKYTEKHFRWKIIIRQYIDACSLPVVK